MPPMCLYICVCSHAIGTFLLRSPLRAGLSPRRLVLTPFRQRANKTQREYARSVCLARTRRPLPCSSPPASPARATPAFGNTDTGQSACMPARLGGLMVQPHVGVPAPLPVCPAPKLHAMKAKKKKRKKGKKSFNGKR
jgi:hypothetical protein